MTTNEIEAVNLFCKRASEIQESTAYNVGKIKLQIQVKGGERGTVRMGQQAPADDALIALITLLRQFYLNHEAISFNRIYNIIWRSLSDQDDEKRKYLKSIYAAYKQITDKGNMNLKINDKKIKPVDIIDIWFYGKIFHSDKEKVNKYEWLISSQIGQLVDFEFKCAVMNLSNVVVHFSDFIKKMILANTK